MNWKNAIAVEAWEQNRKQNFQLEHERDCPDCDCYRCVKSKQQATARGLTSDEWAKKQCERIFACDGSYEIGPDYESLLDRAHRDEGFARKQKPQPKGPKFLVPAMMERTCAGEIAEPEWVLHPMLKRQSAGILAKSKELYMGGLTAKAERQCACGIVGGKVICETGHEFYEAYECELRYCPRCGPRLANALIKKHEKRLLFVAQSLMLCGTENCSECERAIKDKDLPHWPPPTGAKPRIVCAKLDFTVRSDASTMPAPERMRMLNRCIKKFCRAIEKQFHIGRNTYGLAYCDELGGNNNNPHAHGIYVGPWLPNTKKELAALWEKVTEKDFPGTFIISIKYARNFGEALYHACKYPAKFAERSSPQRLAELEIIFHRVRRFHTLARFYNPDAPEETKEPRECPMCLREGFHVKLSTWVTLEGVLELKARGLRDLDEVTRQTRDALANAPPIKHD